MIYITEITRKFNFIIFHIYPFFRNNFPEHFYLRCCSSLHWFCDSCLFSSSFNNKHFWLSLMKLIKNSISLMQIDTVRLSSIHQVTYRNSFLNPIHWRELLSFKYSIFNHFCSKLKIAFSGSSRLASYFCVNLPLVMWLLGGKELRGKMQMLLLNPHVMI